MVEAHLFIDQIEEDLAVLIEDGAEAQEYFMPLTRLPEGAKEGSWLTVEIPAPYTLSSFYAAVQDGREELPEFVLDEATSQVVKQGVQSLMDELSG